MFYNNNASTQDEWSNNLVDAVWNKAKPVANLNPNLYRMDMSGAIIERAKHGDTSQETGFGWEIDHIVPKSLGGTSEIQNLQPLQWLNNRAKDNTYPCSYENLPVTSDGRTNRFRILIILSQ